MLDALEGLSGLKKAELKKFKDGLFVVQIEEKAAVKPSEVEKNIAGFELEKVELTIVGSVADDGKTVTLTARNSGMKVELVDPKVCEESVLKQVRDHIAKGKTTLKLSGLYKEVKVGEKKETKLVLELNGAAPVEEKKP